MEWRREVDERAGAIALALAQARVPDLRLPAVVRADCAYTHKLLQRAFARRSAKWRVLPADTREALALRWDEYEAIPWEEALAPPYCMVSSFCIRKGLGRKANMARTLAHHASRCKGGAGSGGCPLAAPNALPQTFAIDTVSVFTSRPRWLDLESALAECLYEAVEAMEAAAAERAAEAGAGSGSGGAGASPPPAPLWILKPSLTNKGAGILLLSTPEELADAVKAEPDVGQWVLQRYLERPLLIDPHAPAPPAAGGVAGAALLARPPRALHKFHLRVYVAAVGALSVHVFREALVLSAARPYAPHDPADRSAHISNTCVGVEEGGADFDESAHVRCLSELPAILLGSRLAADEGDALGRVQALFSGICALTAHAFAAQEAQTGGYMPLPAGWELYGLDFLVDEAFQPVLLEFNPSPDVKQTGGRLEPIIAGLLEGLVQVAVDARVSPRLVPRDGAAAAGSGGGCSSGSGSDGGGAGGGVEGRSALEVGPRVPGRAVAAVDVEPPLPPGGVHANGVARELPAWLPGCAGTDIAAAAGVPFPAGTEAGGAWDPSGFVCIYSRKWLPAHQQMSVSFS